MKPNQLGAFDFLAGLRACGLAGLRACGLAGLLCAAFPVTSQVNTISKSLIQAFGYFSGNNPQKIAHKSAQEKLGSRGCQTTIREFVTTDDLLIVKLTSRPQNCTFEDLKFILNGKMYDLDALDTTFDRSLSPAIYLWKAAGTGVWLSFKIGRRLESEELVNAVGAFGIHEITCKSSDNCFTSELITLEQERLAAAKVQKEREQAAAKAAVEFEEAARKRRDYERSPSRES